MTVVKGKNEREKVQLDGEADGESSKRAGGRWLVLSAAMLMMLSCGSVYGFGALSSKVKDKLDASESEIQLIGIMGNLGMAAGQFVGGLVVDRFGPRPTMVCAGVMLAVGYEVLYMALSSSGSSPGGRASWATPYTATVLWFIVGHGCGWLYNAALFTSARNFGDARRGMVVGLLSSFMGAASTVFVSLLNACVGGHLDGDDCSGGALNGDIAGYMMLSGIVTTGFAFLGAALTWREDPEEVPLIEEEESFTAITRLNRMLGMVLFVIFYVMLGGMLHATKTQHYIAYGLWSPFVLAALLMTFFLIPLKQCAGRDASLEETHLLGKAPESLGGGEQSSASHGRGQGRTSEYGGESLALSVVADTISVYAEDTAGPKQWLGPLTPREVIVTPEFWLLWLMAAGVLGANIMTLNIVSTIVKDRKIGDTLGVENQTMANVLMMAIMSLSSVARVVTGRCIWKLPNLPRLTYWFVSNTCGLAAQLLWSADSAGTAIAAAVLMGISDGTVWTILPWLSGKMFGLRNNGGNFGMCILLCAVGWVLLSNVAEPMVYKHYTHDPATPAEAEAESGSNECYGIDCFRTTHLIASGGLAASMLASIALAFRLRRDDHFGQWL